MGCPSRLFCGIGQALVWNSVRRPRIGRKAYLNERSEADADALRFILNPTPNPDENFVRFSRGWSLRWMRRRHRLERGLFIPSRFAMKRVARRLRARRHFFRSRHAMTMGKRLALDVVVTFALLAALAIVGFVLYRCLIAR